MESVQDEANILPFLDIHELFMAFNKLYFGDTLEFVSVEWSPKMTLCAGLCEYDSRCKWCRIKLSQPLLSLRPVTDLVDTLLHECIHAYLFVTNSKTDHDAHGQDFIYHMERINKLADSHITVYHNFFEEVDFYRTHHWKCTVCGWLVKRAMNRAPSSRDPWWPIHQLQCSGVFKKVQEPNKKRKGHINMLPIETYFSKDEERNKQ